MAGVARGRRRAPGSSAGCTPGRRPAGRRPPGRRGAASPPEQGAAAAAELGAERAFASAEELVEADGVDVVHICTPNHLHEPLALTGAGRRQARRLREAAGARRRRRRARRDAAAEAGRVVDRALRLPLPPDGPARRGPGSAAGELGAAPAAARQLPAGLAAHAPTTSTGGSTPALGGPSRAFADIGSHWCDLVEFVTGSPHHPAARPHRHRRRRTGRGARPSPSAPPAGPTAARAEPVDTEDVGAGAVRDRPRRARVGRREPGLARPEEPPVVRDRRRRRRRWSSTRRTAEHLWLGRRDRPTTILARDPADLAPDAARLATLPAGHAQGYQDCFDLSWPTPTRRWRASARRACPLVADGVRAARITDAVLASARTGGRGRR